MIAEMMKLASIVRLKSILKSRYGKGLEITTMVDSEEIPRDEGCLMRGTSLLIPVMASGHYLATAIIPKADTLSDSDRHAVSQLVRMILEPEFYSWYLDQMTHNSLYAPSSSDNIISLNPAFDMRESLLDSYPESDGRFSGPTTEALVQSTSVLFLEAKTPMQIQKIAVDIHEVSERWAYLRFQDVKDQILSVQNLLELGSLTLFIDDILNIGDFHREILASYFQHPHTGQEPLILIGSSTSLQDLLSNDMLHPDLARILESHRLEVDRLPRTRDLFREAIEMVL
jgi:hypothetical protein